VRFRFREVPEPAPRKIRARPIVDAVVEGLDIAPQACLLDSSASHAWTVPVWFCDPWVPSFGHLGLTGFFDHFEVMIASYADGSS
jgi:hypothetical protein